MANVGCVSRLVAPQALRLIIPPAGALFVSMLKDSSLVSLMGLWELNFLAQSYARASYHYMEMLIAAALIYWTLSLVFELVQFRLERRFGRSADSDPRNCARVSRLNRQPTSPSDVARKPFSSTAASRRS